MKDRFRQAGGSILGLALVALVAMGPAGCGDDGSGNGSGLYDLTFNGTGFGPHDGQTLYLVVVDEATDQVVQSDSAAVSGGSFSFIYPGLLQDGGTYRIDYYADVNANAECEVNDDHYWSVGISAVSGDVVVDESHSLNFDPAACESFPGDGEPKSDLTISGTGFGPHDGQTLYVSVVRLDNDNEVEAGSAVVAGGAFSFNWVDAVEKGKSYRVDYFADVDSDGLCTAGADHVWRESIGAVAGDVVLDLTHSLDFTDAACESFAQASSFDLTFTGTGFGPHDGQTLYLSVRDAADDSELDAQSVVVSGGAFSFSWAGALAEGGNYYVDFYADVDGDAFCTGGTDHVWREAIDAVAADVVLDVTHSLNFTDEACESFPMAQSFDLTFTGIGFGPHDGQTLFAAVIEVGSGAEVGSDSADVSGGVFAFSWPGLLMEGKDYRIDYYADVDDDGQCAQGSDHVWSVEIPSVGDAVLVEETHSVSFDFQACDSF